MGTAASVTNTFTAGTKAKASEVNTNFTDLVNAISDGTITLESAAFRAATGTTSEPGFAFIGDTDTGFNFYTTGVFDVIIGGNRRARFNDTGLFVGSAVTNPSAQLHVGGTAANARIEALTSTSDAELLFSNGVDKGMIGIDATNDLLAIVGGTSTLANTNKFFASVNNRFGVGTVGSGSELLTVFDQATLNSGLLVEAQTNGIAYVRYQSDSNVQYNYMDTAGNWRLGSTLAAGSGFGVDTNGNPFVQNTSGSIGFTSGSGGNLQTKLGLTSSTGYLYIIGDTTAAEILSVDSAFGGGVATTIFNLSTNQNAGDTVFELKGRKTKDSVLNLLRSTTTADARLVFDSVTTISLQGSGSPTLNMSLGGDFIVSGAKVAIGATDTSSQLKVRKNEAGMTASSNDVLHLTVADTTDLTDVGILFGVQGGSGTEYNTARVAAVLSGAGDTDLIFQTSSDSGSTKPERMRITHDGNVGIGITAATSPLHLGDQDNVDTLHFGVAGSGYKIGRLGSSGFLEIAGEQTTYSGFRFKVNDTTEVFTILNNGNVGIGTTSPGSALDINTGTFSGNSTFGRSSSTPAMRLSRNTSANNGVIYARNEYANTMTGAQHSVIEAAFAQDISAVTSDGTNAVFVRCSDNHGDTTSAGSTLGNLRATSAGTGVELYTASDSRLKKNKRVIDNALATIMQLEPVEFQWKKNDAIDHGFYAQDLHKVYPSAVSKGGTDSKREPWSVAHTRLIPIMVKGIQEMQETIQAQATQIADLTARLTELENA